jgi:hypothetical protein
MTSPAQDNHDATGPDHDTGPDHNTGPDHGADHRRDGDAVRIMGIFFAVLGAAVLSATQWGELRDSAQILNIAAAAALILTGGGFFISGQWLRRRSTSQDHAESS